MDQVGFVSGASVYRVQENEQEPDPTPVASSSKQQAKLGAYFESAEGSKLEVKKRKYAHLTPKDCRRRVYVPIKTITGLTYL